MRRPILYLLVTTAFAAADPVKPKAIPQDAIDPAPVVDKLIALRDDLGAIYIVPVANSFGDYNAAGKWVFFGNSKAVYQQRVFTTSHDYEKTAKYEWEMWAPRAGFSHARLNGIDNKPFLDCGGKKRALEKLGPDEAKTLFKNLKLYPPIWQRRAKFLARDERGIHYYVDELREEYGGKGYNVYVGVKGAMKALAMTNVVSDSAGDIYSTKTGQLKIITDHGGSALWIKGKQKRPLTVLPLRDNEYVIYRDLGIYGALGIVCDDL